MDMTSGDCRQQNDLRSGWPDDHPTRLCTVNYGDVLVMGGTSDARMLCQQLDAANVAYTLSVATPTGKQLAGDIKGQVRCGRLEREHMVAGCRKTVRAG